MPKGSRFTQRLKLPPGPDRGRAACTSSSTPTTKHGSHHVHKRVPLPCRTESKVDLADRSRGLSIHCVVSHLADLIREEVKTRRTSLTSGIRSHWTCLSYLATRLCHAFVPAPRWTRISFPTLTRSTDSPTPACTAWIASWRKLSEASLVTISSSEVEVEVVPVGVDAPEEDDDEAREDFARGELGGG